jgi:hypothetical protein
MESTGPYISILSDEVLRLIFQGVREALGSQEELLPILRVCRRWHVSLAYELVKYTHVALDCIGDIALGRCNASDQRFRHRYSCSNGAHVSNRIPRWEYDPRTGNRCSFYRVPGPCLD